MNVKNQTLALFISILLCITVIGAFLMTEHHIFPYPYLKKIDVKLSSIVKRALGKFKTPVHDQTTSVETIFLQADLNQVAIPVEKKGRGGGLASYKNELWLLTFDGELYRIDPENAIRSKIQLPDTGHSHFLELENSEKYAGFKLKPLDLTQPRFHDLLFFSEPDRSGMIVSYIEWRPDLECYNTALAVLDIPDTSKSIMSITASPEDWDVIYRTEPCLPLKNQNNALEGHMAGARIAYKSPYRIYLASGDYHWDGSHHPDTLSDKLDNDYGKVIELNLQSGESKNIAYGLRNMQGITVDQEGRIWTVEHGVRGGDELNLIKNGRQYGWPRATLGTTYGKKPYPMIAGSYGRHDHGSLPVYAWLPSVGISNITQINDFHSSWDGDLLAASLIGNSLFRIRLDNERVVFVEQIKIGDRIRYVHQHTDGKIYMWTDRNTVLILDNPQIFSSDDFITSSINGLNLNNPSVNKQLREELENCQACHRFDKEESDPKAPSLKGIYGRKIGKSNYKHYSASLSSIPGNWDIDSLTSYLKDPKKFAADTYMPDPGIKDEKVLNALVELLKNNQVAAQK